jgi:hypothetical protein
MKREEVVILNKTIRSGMADDKDTPREEVTSECMEETKQVNERLGTEALDQPDSEHGGMATEAKYRKLKDRFKALKQVSTGYNSLAGSLQGAALLQLKICSLGKAH